MSKKIVVIYKSKYGTTKKYAEMISKELNADLYEQNKITTKMLLNYDIIIYGGPLYAGGIPGIRLIKNSMPILENRKVILFTVGLSDPTDEENINNIRNGIKKVFTKQELEKIDIYHLRGGIDYTKLNFIHRNMMKILYSQISKLPKEQLHGENKDFIETYGKVVNFVDKNTIKPIIEKVREYKL